jgi:hypothetical protein
MLVSEPAVQTALEEVRNVEGRYLMGIWSPETSEYDPLTHPNGKDMASMWSPFTVARADEEVADAIGLVVVSEDGLIAHGDVRAAIIIQRLPLASLD